MEKLELQVRDFDLVQIFECGQCFRWERQADGSYFGIVSNKAVYISLENRDNYSGVLTIEAKNAVADRAFWESYFDLSRDYGKIKEQLAAKDKKLAVAISYGEGIRILKQDIFETIISFIVSQNSNIPRIKKCINAIAEKFGERIVCENGGAHYAFPTVFELQKAGVEDLKMLKLGYRAEYIAATSARLARNHEEFARIGEMDYKTAREFLLGLSGIGPKVADCILLFGLGKFEAFPIDVWVKRVMHDVYGFDEKDTKGMNEYAATHFGDNGGIAQQYLFYYIRTLAGK